MKLNEEQAAAIFAALPTSLRAAASMQAIGDPAAFARYVRAACEVAGDVGLHATATGEVRTGRADVSPAQSEAHMAIAAADPAVVKRADAAIKAAVSKEQRSAALVRALYAGGFALKIGVVRADEP
ncbi:MAG: hypothetical protein FJ100_15225 [Deltaproteobacteria bacterium]|nr:hypothetical protein [Deltaproteobacteria bacterium]